MRVLEAAYDRIVDAAYLKLEDGPVGATDELSDVCVIDVDLIGQLRGIEVLSCREFARDSFNLAVQQNWLTAAEADELLTALHQEMARK